VFAPAWIRTLALAAVLAAPLLPAQSAQQTPDSAGEQMEPDRAAVLLLARARAARLRTDSALRSYDATARGRFTVGVMLRGVGRERVIIRDESAGRVQWSRDGGVRVEVLGRRRESSGFFGGNRSGSADRNDDTAVPVPFFPGKEPLWLGGSSGFVTTTIDDRRSVHPLVTGAEAYYRYEIGDSISISLGDRSRIVLRELRVTPRRANWRVLSASLWFDMRTAQLVRAAYRFSAPVDVWEQARTAIDPANRPPKLMSLLAAPLRGTLEAVTVENGLYEGQFWLPRLQIADYNLEAPSQTRVSSRLEQRFDYASVNGTFEQPAPLPAATIALRARSDSLWIVDSTQAARRDSLLPSARSKRDTAALFAAYHTWEDSAWKPIRAERESLRKSQCAATGTYARYRTRYGRRVPAEVFIPCDTLALTRAAIFAGDLMSQNDQVWGSRDREALVSSLAKLAPLEWSPQPVQAFTSLEYFRYNRIEGASLGGALRQELGNGLRWEANARVSVADRQANGELFLERSGPRRLWRAAAYRRLTQADDYGAAFALGASIQNLFSGLDEQFYYRNAGAELTGTRTAPIGGGSLTWRLFAEQQGRAVPRANFVLSQLWNDDAQFDRNVIDSIPGSRGKYAGGSVRWRALRGDDASPWRLATDMRVEAASGATSYGRAATDITVERRLPLKLRTTLLGSVGNSVGSLPVQRWWNLGGWQTVRGVVAGSQRGDAFWMARAELQWDGLRRVQPVVFSDLGWAGDRRAFSASPQHLRSAGAGVSLLRGLFRLDAARSIDAGGQWRVDFYAVARF